ncbi:hypothetical protein [Hymenobacter mucosus]|uniref:Uncharacterized protein n=1 Tax=Hymenobacter mucosus TaxID=1411120 RepID=A0A239AJM4_9BACT|nr:hypothetical protein [Hymenobacter mucosus]SNR95542.1 hypothetical protein SAMN06269173_11318 [Hymenobacter mucosus]
MSTTPQPDDELQSTTNAAQLGPDQGPVTTPENDPRDMSTVLANPESGEGPDTSRSSEAAETGAGSPTMQRGSEFDEQRREGAVGTGDNSAAVGPGEGMGRAGFNGDEDRGYDQSGHRGGLGSSGGREDLTDRNLDTAQNPFIGGYSGGTTSTPDDAIRQRIGMNSHNPTDDSAAQDSSNSANT